MSGGPSGAKSRFPELLTQARLQRDLKSLGIKCGQVLLLHSALSRLGGYLPGGPETLVHALLACLGDQGTLVMPSHTGHNTEPSRWISPPVPESWWPILRAEREPFDPQRSVTRGMGVVAEYFRSWPGAFRSNHPVVSFSAVGATAERICARHPIEDFFGDDSPLGALYQLDAKVLLLGCGHESNTSLHLAEARAQWPGKSSESILEGSAVLIDGQRQWIEYRAGVCDSDDFPSVGEAYEATGAGREGLVGAARARLFEMRPMIDFAKRRFSQTRGRSIKASDQPEDEGHERRF